MTTQLEGMAATIRQLQVGLNQQRQQTASLLEAFNRRLVQVEKALGIQAAPMLPQSAQPVAAAPAAPRPPGAPPAPAPIKNRPVARPIQSRGTTPNGSAPPASASAVAAPPGQVLPGVSTGDLQALVVGLVQNALGSLVQGLAAPAAEPAPGEAPAVLDVPAEPVLDGTLQGTPHTPSASDTSWLHEEAAAGGPPVPPIVGEVSTASVSHPR